MASVFGDFEDLRKAVAKAVNQKMKNTKSEAESRAQKIKDEAEKRADSVKVKTLADARHRAQEIKRDRMTEANREAIKKRLRAREEILDKVWERAENTLRDLVESDNYVQTLRNLTWLIAKELGEGKIVLAADENGHQQLTQQLLGEWGQEASKDLHGNYQFSRAEQPLQTWGGLVGTKRDGKLRVNARFSERLIIARDEIRKEIFNTLMDGS
mgnify:CR=1 FL=1